MTNPNPKPTVPAFTDPRPPIDGWQIVPTGERAMIANNLKEAIAEINTIRVEVATTNPVNVSEGSPIWDAYSVIHGNLANVGEILFGIEGGPI